MHPLSAHSCDLELLRLPGMETTRAGVLLFHSIARLHGLDRNVSELPADLLLRLHVSGREDEPPDALRRQEIKLRLIATAPLDSLPAASALLDQPAGFPRFTEE